MGGAFVGLADDWSAAFWNPAGLTSLGGWGVGGSMDFLAARSMDGNSMANPPLPFTQANVEQGDAFYQLGGEPSRFNITDTTIRTVLPSFVGYRAGEHWAGSLGAFAPLGFAFDVDDQTIPGIHAKFESQGYILMYNASMSYRWRPGWAVGAGVNVLDARVQREATKTTDSYTLHGTSDGRGQALQGVFGVLARVHRTLSLGAVYKTGADLDLKGAATVTDTRLPLTFPGFGTVTNESSAARTRVRNPAVYAVGLAWSHRESTTLTADWQGTDWTPTHVDLQFDRPGVILQNQDFDARWRFTHRARVGGQYRREYRPRKQWSAYAGYSWDPSAIPDSAVSITNLVDVSRHFYSVGMGWRTGSWEPTLGFLYATGSRSANGVEYKHLSRLLSLSLQYRY